MRFTTAPKAYVLAAAIIAEDATEEIRAAIRPLRGAGNKLHWRDLEPRQRDRVVDVVVAMEAMHLIVIATPLDQRRQERARAKCIEQLLAHLATMGVARVVLEQRTESLNRLDRELIPKLRGSRSLPPSIHLDLGQPSKEPLLWVPDIVAGAVGDELSDPSTPWAKRLEPCLQRLGLDLGR